MVIHDTENVGNIDIFNSVSCIIILGLFASQHAPTCSNTLQSIVLRYVYYRMERVGASRSMLGHYDANKPISSEAIAHKMI